MTRVVRVPRGDARTMFVMLDCLSIRLNDLMYGMLKLFNRRSMLGPGLIMVIILSMLSLSRLLRICWFY